MKENNNNNIQLVDLGLPSGNIWVDRNIGADSPEHAGLYFAWGETKGFTVEDVKFGVHSFNQASYKAKEIDDDLTPEQDAAHAYLGKNFYIPTKKDFKELLANCDATWTDNYKGTNVSGHIFTSKTNGNSIFFPASGNCSYSSVDNVGSYGYYWSASCEDAGCAYRFLFDNGGQSVYYGSRLYGFPVRGVYKKCK